MALRLYQHSFPDDLDVLRDRMDEAHSREQAQRVLRPDRGLNVVRDDELNNETALPGILARPR
jgi:hypothetical protein